MNTKIDQINFCYLGLPLCLELCPTRNSLAEAVDTGTSPCNNRSSIGVYSVAKNLRGQGRLNVYIRLGRDFSVDVGLCRDFLVNIRNSSLRPLLPELSSARHTLAKTVDTGSSPGNSRTSIGVDSVTENLRGQSRLNVNIGLSRDFNMDIGLCWYILVYVRNCSLRPLLSSSSGRPLGDKVLISLLLKDPVILGVDISNTRDSSRDS